MSLLMSTRSAGNSSLRQRQVRRRLYILAIAALPVAVLAGCTEDKPVAESESSVSRSSEPESDGPGRTDSADGTGSNAGDEPASGTGSSAPTGGCRYLEVSETGVYDLGEVGSVSISRTGGEVTLKSANPADGWTSRPDGDSDDVDEVEVDFTRGDRRVEFDAEIERDDRLEVKLCETGHSGD